MLRKIPHYFHQLLSPCKLEGNSSMCAMWGWNYMASPWLFRILQWCHWDYIHVLWSLWLIQTIKEPCFIAYTCLFSPRNVKSYWPTLAVILLFILTNLQSLCYAKIDSDSQQKSICHLFSKSYLILFQRQTFLLSNSWRIYPNSLMQVLTKQKWWTCIQLPLAPQSRDRVILPLLSIQFHQCKKKSETLKSRLNKQVLATRGASQANIGNLCSKAANLVWILSSFNTNTGI